MLSAAQMETGPRDSVDDIFVEPTADVDFDVAAQLSPDNGIGDSVDEIFVEPTAKLNGQAEAGAEGSVDELFF